MSGSTMTWCAVCMDRPRRMTTNHIPHCTEKSCMAYVRWIITGKLEAAK